MKKLNQKKYFSILIFLILMVIFVTTSLLNFYKKINLREYHSKLDTLEELSLKGKTIVENKLEGYLNSLQSIEVFLEKDNIHSQKNLNLVSEITEEKNSFFHGIGIANTNGDALVQNGATAETLNISDRQYFKSCMNKKPMITDRKNSDFITNLLVFIVSVPIMDSDENVIGVLFGIVELDRFTLYKDAVIDEESQYIQIIDQNGVYISREEPSKTIVHDENIFDGLYSIESSVPADEIIQGIKNREIILTEVKNWDDERIVYFTPLEINNWYIVTVMKKDRVINSIKYLLKNDVYILMAKVIGSTLLLCTVIFYYSYKEKKKILKLNEQLKFNDEIFKIASDKYDFTIMIYDIESKCLKFINNGISNVHIPSIIENAPTEFPKLFPYSKSNMRNFKSIFDNIDNTNKQNDFNMPFIIKGEIRHLRIQLHNLFNEKGKIVQCVGIMTDITDQIHLKKEVELRETLLSNTIGFMEIDLDEDLILQRSDNILDHYTYSNSFSDYMKWTIDNTILPEYREYAKERLSIEFLRDAFLNDKHDVISEYQCYNPDGKYIWLECSFHLERDLSSNHIMAYLVMRDIDKKKKEELDLIDKANKDWLTGLYNRRKGIEKIDEILQETDFKTGKTHVFIIFDLDKFKMLNDTLGHQIGDNALKDVADILRGHFLDYDILCRLGGDEFVVFLKDIPIEVVEKNVNSLLKKLNLCYESKLNYVNITASAGIAVAPFHGVTFKELYAKADIALYNAKEDGKNVFKIFPLEK